MDFNIESVKRKMLVKYPFFGSVVANVNYRENKKISTACTDGQTIFYNLEFLKNLNTDEQIFIFAHEVCHIAFDHIRRSENKDPYVWNIATDGVINQFLKRDGLKLVDGVVDIAEAINYDAEEFYDKLLKEKQQSKRQNGQGNQQNQQSSSSSEQGQQDQGQNSSKDSQKQNENQSQGQNSETQNEEQNQEQSNSQQNQQSSSSSKQGQQGQGQSSSKGSQKQNENQSQGQNSETQNEEQNQEQSNSQQNQQSSSSSKQGQQGQGQGTSSSESIPSEEQNDNVSHDTHSMWKDAVKKLKEAVSKNKKESQSNEQNEEKSEEQTSSSQNQQGTSEQRSQDQSQSSLDESQNQNENQSQGQGTSSSESIPSEEQNDNVSHDTHSMWKDAVKKLKEAVSKNKKESQSNEQNEEKSEEQTSSSQNQQGTSEQRSQDQSQSSLDESQNQNENQSQGQGTSSSESIPSEEQNDDVGHDTHSMWKDAVKKLKEAESKDKKEFQDDEQQMEEQNQQEKRLQQEIGKISKMGEKSAFKKNLEEKRKELEELKQVLSQQAIETVSQEAMEAGTSTNSEQRIINDIGKSKPIIDWRYILKEPIQYDVDWSYKNAYIEDDVIHANLEEQPKAETEILLDTSGSVNERLLKNFLRECLNILPYSKIKVGCFDTKFYGFHEIRTEADIENMGFEGLEGNGGTDFNVAVRAFTKRVENKIIFTDGIASMPDIPMDVIWIVFGNKINPKGGKVIQISYEQLIKLYSIKRDISYKEKNR